MGVIKLVLGLKALKNKIKGYTIAMVASNVKKITAIHLSMIRHLFDTIINNIFTTQDRFNRFRIPLDRASDKKTVATVGKVNI